jgi:hypothetical protein
MRQKLSDLALVILTAKKAAHRIGATFTLRDDRIGLPKEQIDQVWRAVDEIERFQEKRLAELDSWSRS